MSNLSAAQSAVYDKDRAEWDRFINTECKEDHDNQRNGVFLFKQPAYENINTWVDVVIRCNGFIKNNVSVIQSEGSTRISNGFGSLENGQRMKASGNYNDCFIHSFLICTSVEFRKINTESDRDKIAHWFRRFVFADYLNTPGAVNILPIIGAKNAEGKEQQRLNQEKIIHRFRSHEPLFTSDAELIAKAFNITIIIIKDGSQDYERLLEPLNMPDGPFNYLVIHGTGGHFTPVQYGGSYIKSSNNGEEFNQLLQQFETARSNEAAVLSIHINEEYRRKWNQHIEAYHQMPITTNDEKQAKQTAREVIFGEINADLHELTQLGLDNEQLRQLIMELTKQMQTNSSRSNVTTKNDPEFIKALKESTNQALEREEREVAAAINAVKRAAETTSTTNAVATAAIAAVAAQSSINQPTLVTQSTINTPTESDITTPAVSKAHLKRLSAPYEMEGHTQIHGDPSKRSKYRATVTEPVKGGKRTIKRSKRRSRKTVHTKKRSIKNK